MSNYAEVKRNIWSNAVSNYVRTVLGMIVGLLTFRMLYQAFSKEQFGFWSLLWSVFGYGILLDFGFGFAAQKRVAELSVKQDWDKLSRVLSTILFFYFGVATMIAVVVLLGSGHIIGLFGVSPENSEDFRRVLEINLTAPIYWALELLGRIAEDRFEHGLKRWKSDEAIQGTVPDLTRLPSGCVFASRCPLVHTACQQVPDLHPVDSAGRHQAACWAVQAEETHS